MLVLYDYHCPHGDKDALDQGVFPGVTLHPASMRKCAETFVVLVTGGGEKGILAGQAALLAWREESLRMLLNTPQRTGSPPTTQGFPKMLIVPSLRNPVAGHVYL